MYLNFAFIEINYPYKMSLHTWALRKVCLYWCTLKYLQGVNFEMDEVAVL